MKDTRLVKSVMIGVMQGTNKRGRPNRAWLDDIQEWCGKGVDDFCKDAMNRLNWKKYPYKAVKHQRAMDPRSLKIIKIILT